MTLTRKVSRPVQPAEVLELLEQLTAWPLMVVDYAMIRAAVELTDRGRLSFWDALIVVAAAHSGASILYSEDLNEGQEILGVRITNPVSTA